ncbi:MAG: hypothetical protein WED07_12290 [Candidatus Freyarchaeum deiterrae]
MNTNLLRFIFKDTIDELKEEGYELVKEEKQGAIFKIKPLKSEEVDSLIFEDKALIYSKQRKGRVLNICINPSITQVERHR